MPSLCFFLYIWWLMVSLFWCSMVSLIVTISLITMAENLLAHQLVIKLNFQPWSSNWWLIINSWLTNQFVNYQPWSSKWLTQLSPTVAVSCLQWPLNRALKTAPSLWPPSSMWWPQTHRDLLAGASLPSYQKGDLGWEGQRLKIVLQCWECHLRLLGSREFFIFLNVTWDCWEMKDASVGSMRQRSW